MCGGIQAFAEHLHLHAQKPLKNPKKHNRDSLALAEMCKSRTFQQLQVPLQQPS